MTYRDTHVRVNGERVIPEYVDKKIVPSFFRTRLETFAIEYMNPGRDGPRSTRALGEVHVAVLAGRVLQVSENVSAFQTCDCLGNGWKWSWYNVKFYSGRRQ